MTFAELYAYANGHDGATVPVKALAAQVSAFHVEVGAVNFWPVELDTSISLGHILYEYDRDSPYEGEYKIANIRYEKTLNRCWRRFVCCKELMHVFDTEEQSTNTRDRFLGLLNELETTPPPGQRTPIYESEFRAQWMALLVLCPESKRVAYKADWDAKDITDYDVAVALRVPEGAVRNLMGPMYEISKSVLLPGV